jgi:hypothetical protein
VLAETSGSSRKAFETVMIETSAFSAISLSLTMAQARGSACAHGNDS